MTNMASLTYAQADLQRVEPYVLEFHMSVASGAPTLATSIPGYPVFVGGADSDFTQAGIDAFLGSVNEFAVTTAFGATSMGTDVIGFVINMSGQAKSALWVSSMLASSATPPVGTTKIALGQGTSTTVLANTLVSNVAVTTLGNIYGKISTLTTDTGATNVLKISVGWLPK